MKHIEVVAGIIEHEGKILCMERDQGKYDYVSFKWEFPGGKLEAGETSQQAIVREIKEELDVEISVGDLIQTIEYDYPDFHLSMDCFWAEISAGQILPKEALEAKWLGKDNLFNVEWLPADLLIIPKIKEMIALK